MRECSILCPQVSHALARVHKAVGDTALRAFVGTTASLSAITADLIRPDMFYRREVPDG
ncbi:hypothetical protein IE4872_PC00340 (plasmid) [Rhizobium gallicum]|uniref:Uncharacterized protein n=1 Tax=Rhizobium gallicum TaxID=56730 RepID=A0A1L5NR29_9HYPH|nr:hypothetical protein IE4872_PC00340 [Rhizobium gallicum]